MRLVSWNVQGLGGTQYLSYRGRLRQELQRCLVGGSIDILLLREHHLSESRIRRYGSILSSRYETFWSAGFGPRSGQGGVCISIAESWKAAIVDRCIIVPGRAQYVTMRFCGEHIGVLNVYAPNQASARAEFWAQIADALPAVEHWCVEGDFNMLEDPLDRVGGSQTTLHGSELAAWERLCMTLRISDVWQHEAFLHAPGSLDFSRSDRRQGGTNLSRLDRFYVSDWLGEHGDSVGILAGTSFSDHAPVVLALE